MTLDPGWKKFESGTRDKHPGSATLTGTKQKSTIRIRNSTIYGNVTDTGTFASRTVPEKNV
jgi:hypothetical protein